jgi:8-oxo-dGTP pyrophosphatase MutT (NUDIX family)
VRPSATPPVASVFVEAIPSLSAASPLNDATRAAIAGALGAHTRVTVDVPERRKAAVLILLFEREGEPWVVLTKRTETVSTHKGEISFPGGAHDDVDTDTWVTAVRETQEELGVDPAGLTLLGALDDYPTFSSGFIVSPYVAALQPQAWEASEAEIAHVIELPLRTLWDAARMEIWEREGVRFPMHIFEVGSHYVWGVTAFILRRFLDIVGPALGYEVQR